MEVNLATLPDYLTNSSNREYCDLCGGKCFSYISLIPEIFYLPFTWQKAGLHSANPQNNCDASCCWVVERISRPACVERLASC